MRERTRLHCFTAVAAILGLGCSDPPPYFTTGLDTGGTGTEDTGGDDDDDTGPPVDCESIPTGPFSVTKVPNAVATEDVAFDDEGHLVGSNFQAIFKSPYGGTPEVFVPNFSFRAGMRYLSTGDLVVCDDYASKLVRVDKDGVKHDVLFGLAYPNGITTDKHGFAYFTEHDAGNVIRVDPYTGDFTYLVPQGSLPNANGISFDREYESLFIGQFCADPNATLWRLPIDEDGTPGDIEPFATGIGSGCLDGIGVDACGNVYICDYCCWGSCDDTCVYRISPDGVVDPEPILDPPESGYMPNLDWGTGDGGWRTDAIYLPDGWGVGVWEAVIGVPSKPRSFP